MLDRFFDQAETAEGAGEEGAQEEAGQGKQGVAQRQRGDVVVTPEEALQVAQMMPSPTEGGLASFFDHLAQTQVSHFVAPVHCPLAALLSGGAGSFCVLPSMDL